MHIVCCSRLLLITFMCTDAICCNLTPCNQQIATTWLAVCLSVGNRLLRLFLCLFASFFVHCSFVNCLFGCFYCAFIPLFVCSLVVAVSFSSCVLPDLFSSITLYLRHLFREHNFICIYGPRLEQYLRSTLVLVSFV